MFLVGWGGLGRTSGVGFWNTVKVEVEIGERATRGEVGF